ncbi:lysozyme C-like [Engystomops pustulosus]|uniref:lysozyme C-like n=1 Tax=Engystomops pustulosus TaxID=76066 RepID=UPI003AFAD596
MKIFLVLILSAIAASSLALDKCTVLRAVKDSGLGGYKGYTAGDYVCLAYYASGYNPLSHNSPGLFGVFQISSYWWCDDGITPGRKNLCNIPCSALQNNNLVDDLQCVSRIVHDPNGLNAWDPWKVNCKGKDLTRFETGC